MGLLRGMKEREYQARIARTALEKNTLVCLPTGLGKTNIAVLVAAQRLEAFPGSRALVLAPTKPLVHQHLASFRKFLSLEEGAFAAVTGELPPEKRQPLYKATAVFATPQTVQRDLEHERVSLEPFSLLVIDELHHAVGKYAYPYIAKRFLKESRQPRILGLTASPGSRREKILQICRNTGIEAVEIRTETDPDVAPYVMAKDVEWVTVTLPESFLTIRSFLESAYRRRLKHFQGVRTKKDLLLLQQQFQKSIARGDWRAYGLASLVAQALKIEHALTLLETQGIGMLRKYLRGIRQDTSKAAASLLNDREFSNALYLAERLSEQGSRHPKMGRLCSLVETQLRESPSSKIIIFANFRETAREISAALHSVEGAKPLTLLGQRDLTQKEQLATIRQYQEEANCLVTTSIGEEGLSLETADLAVFYEPVPSEIRSIQRRGRVGRTKVGKIAVLVTAKTRDEAYRWVAYRKEKAMKATLAEMSLKQSTLD